MGNHHEELLGELMRGQFPEPTSEPRDVGRCTSTRYRVERLWQGREVASLRAVVAGPPVGAGRGSLPRRVAARGLRPAGGPWVGDVYEVYPAANAARSARLYTVEPRDLLRADRAAEAAGLSLIGVWHSHTHTAAYPSPTDISQAPDPDWHYVLVSLSDAEPVVRSYRIVDGRAEEEPVVTPA